MYSVEEISPKTWETFQKAQPFTPDVQSVEYGNFYESMGEKSLHLVVKEEESTIVAGTLLVSVHAKRGNFLYLPYGPVLVETFDKNRVQDVLKTLFAYIAAYGREHGYAFIRVSPFWDDTKEHRSWLKSIGLRPSPMHILAETTWLNNLHGKTEEQLLQGMNKNHRNLIRRLEREGVKTEVYSNPQHLEKFHTLLDETAKRHNFTRFSRSYIEKEFGAYAASGKACLILGYLPDGTLDAGAIFYHHGSMTAYRHGASLGQNKKLPVSYAVQWQGIKEALKEGKVWYNFWGIAPSNASKKHPFFGITHFKKGFGGEQKDLVHCHDLPLSATYWLSWIIESIRKAKRGF